MWGGGPCGCPPSPVSRPVPCHSSPERAATRAPTPHPHPLPPLRAHFSSQVDVYGVQFIYTLHASMFLNKRHYLIVGRHEVGTARLGDHDGATGVGQAGGRVPVPPLDEAAEQPGGKGIPGPQDTEHLHGEAGCVDLGGTVWGTISAGEIAVGDQVDA